MSTIAANDLTDLQVARHLIEVENKAELRRRGKVVEEKSTTDPFGEDQVFLSEPAMSAQPQAATQLPPIENINLSLAGLQKKIKDLGSANPVQENVVDEGFTVTSSQSVEIKLELRSQPRAPIEGLLVHDQNYAESDRYLFKFADGATFTILDKWTNRSTSIWGDPHVDVNDVPGTMDGDFKDLKASNDLTTFILMDGTRVTFKAKDAGFIEQVDIFKGSQHIIGIGSAARDFSPETGLFSKGILDNAAFAATKTPMGDVVFAGGDGNDWFDAGNKLIWGKTTGPVVTQRPLAILELYYRQTVSQSMNVRTIAKNA